MLDYRGLLMQKDVLMYPLHTILGNAIKMRYLLDQKDNSILMAIQNLFGFGKVTPRSQTDGVYRYTATGLKSMNDVISYFKVFPLLTKKARSFEK
ncbi:orf1059 mitochondrial protein [Diplocarpon rosae]|nr:orf1059 mitochondrial protein [Diplocarpon rosae]